MTNIKKQDIIRDMIHFYKPNAKVTGTATSFWYNTREKSFFSSMIKQESWDSSKRQGSFVKNKKIPEKNVIVKFSPAEIGGILDSIETNRAFSTYHSSKNQISKIKFGKYEREGKQVGFSYGVNKENKEDSTDKVSFIIGFTFGEARLLKEYLIKALHESFVFYTARDDERGPATPSTASSPRGHEGDRGEQGKPKEDSIDSW